MLTDAEKRAWTQRLDTIAATIVKWRLDRAGIDKLVFRREVMTIGYAMPSYHEYEYPFGLCDMDRLKEECRQTIDAHIAMKERELKQETEAFNNALK